MLQNNTTLHFNIFFFVLSLVVAIHCSNHIAFPREFYAIAYPYPQLDSCWASLNPRYSKLAGIEDQGSSRESRLEGDCQLTFCPVLYHPVKVNILAFSCCIFGR